MAMTYAGTRTGATDIDKVLDRGGALPATFGEDVAQERFVGGNLGSYGLKLQLLAFSLGAGVVTDQLETAALPADGLATVALGLPSATGDTGACRALLICLDGRSGQPRDGDLQVAGRNELETGLG